MTAERWSVIGALLLSSAALAHALLTWPLRATTLLFGGGATVAFVAEAAVVQLGLLRHHTRPRIAGVPAVVVVAWPATVYVAYRAASLVVPGGAEAAALAAVLATLFDIVVDPRGVRRGLWTYPVTPVSRPRYRGVPWWNFPGWLAVVFVTANLPVLVG